MGEENKGISELTFKCSDIQTIGVQEELKTAYPSYEELLVEHGRYLAAVEYVKRCYGSNDISRNVITAILGVGKYE